MPSREKLSTDAIQAALAELPAWELKGGKLCRKYEFPDFTHAFGFMAAAATQIQALNHHPEWSNVYGKVEVTLWTHDVGGVTEYDVELAGKLEGIALKLLAT
jgi:4a-hydroxytetrahydrobiopterin dehydratase